jgi:multidrug efflux pump subunit AcrA (membrane-fusion protein)
MTFVGKILVIVIMAFSLLFLALSTVVYTTSKNWMVATTKEREESAKLKKKVQDAQAVSEAAKQGLEDAKVAYAAEKSRLESAIATQAETNKRDLDQLTAARNQQAAADQTAKSTLDEVEDKRRQTELLRTQLSAVEKQANEFKLHQAELNDHIRDLERTLDTATRNNSDLRERVAKFSTLLRTNGLSDDISQLKGLESPPPVVGEVKRIDPTNRVLELTIGGDDGLVPGHQLYIFRVKPRPEYIGKVTIITVDPDQSVAKVIGNTFQGKKIKEGDIVSSTIKPQF